MKTEFKDINKLQEAGYTLIQCSDWHFKVYGEGNVMNVWPSKRKFMVDYAKQASYYQDILKTALQIVGRPQIGRKVRRRLRHRINSEDQAKAKKEHEGMLNSILERCHNSNYKK